jgi:hypothetical protein
MAFKRMFGTERPELHQLVDCFFGPDSKIFQVLKDNISVHHTQFIKFIKTFCVQSGYNLSTQKLFDKNSYFDTSELCTPEEYQVDLEAVWHSMSS